MDGWRVIWSAQKKNSPKDRELNGWHENNSPKEWTTQKSLAKGMDGWKVKWSARPNFPKGRMAEKITRQRDGRVESYMVGTKKNSPKDGELNG